MALDSRLPSRKAKAAEGVAVEWTDGQLVRETPETTGVVVAVWEEGDVPARLRAADV